MILDLIVLWFSNFITGSRPESSDGSDQPNYQNGNPPLLLDPMAINMMPPEYDKPITKKPSSMIEKMANGLSKLHLNGNTFGPKGSLVWKKIMNNFSKTTVWGKKNLQFTAFFFTSARYSWQGNIYFRLWLMYIHYNKTNVYLIIELCIVLLLFSLPLFLSSSWNSTSNYEFRIKKTDNFFTFSVTKNKF